MLSTEGNKSVLGPPKRTIWVETPSIEKEVAFGRAPAIEMLPALSGWTPGARLATTMGLGLLVARKFSASELMSFPDLESLTAKLSSTIAEPARTSTC